MLVYYSGYFNVHSVHQVSTSAINKPPRAPPSPWMHVVERSAHPLNIFMGISGYPPMPPPPGNKALFPGGTRIFFHDMNGIWYLAIPTCTEKVWISTWCLLIIFWAVSKPWGFSTGDGSQGDGEVLRPKSSSHTEREVEGVSFGTPNLKHSRYEMFGGSSTEPQKVFGRLGFAHVTWKLQ